MHFISKEKAIFAMSGENPPVLYANPKSVIVFETCDCFSDQIQSPDGSFDGIDWSRINPATGPVYINGAEIGDSLAVTIHQIEVADSGIAVAGKGFGVLGDVLSENTRRFLQIENDAVIFSEDIRIPLNKMIGVIGVAPKEGAIPCGCPDYHGGNMDCKEIREGATLILPVHVPGALLAMGDLHAAMADGEISGAGLEIPGRVTVTVDVLKGKTYPTPMILNEDHIMTLASHEDLDLAVEMAVKNMVEYMATEWGFERGAAAILLSLVGDVRICQVVDPKKTARVELAKQYLKKQ